MNNYEYIIASLPVISCESSQGLDVDGVLSEIRSLLSEADARNLDFVLDGFDPEKLCEEFYRKALRSPVRFIRNYFDFDLGLRNLKVEFINRKLGRREGTDQLVLGEEMPDFGWEQDAEAILEGEDILKKERGLDDLVWKRVDELTQMDFFDIDFILGFVVKLKIVDRWLKLDPVTGHELFVRIVNEIRNNR